MSTAILNRISIVARSATHLREVERPVKPQRRLIGSTNLQHDLCNARPPQFGSQSLKKRPRNPLPLHLRSHRNRLQLCFGGVSGRPPRTRATVPPLPLLGYQANAGATPVAGSALQGKDSLANEPHRQGFGRSPPPAPHPPVSSAEYALRTPGSRARRRSARPVRRKSPHPTAANSDRPAASGRRTSAPESAEWPRRGHPTPWAQPPVSSSAPSQAERNTASAASSQTAIPSRTGVIAASSARAGQQFPGLAPHRTQTQKISRGDERPKPRRRYPPSTPITSSRDKATTGVSRWLCQSLHRAQPSAARP